MPTVPNGKVCIFGAGGPVGAVTAQSLASHYTLRCVDARSLEEVDQVQADLWDRFGPLPRKVHNLLYSVRVRALAHGADVNLADNVKNTPLIVAAQGGHVEIVEKLLAANEGLDAA